jgi:hypothetical protein
MKKYLVVTEFLDQTFTRSVETDLKEKTEEFSEIIVKTAFETVLDEDQFEDVDWSWEENEPSVSYYEIVSENVNFDYGDHLIKMATVYNDERDKEREEFNKMIKEQNDKREYERLKEKFEKEN